MDAGVGGGTNPRAEFLAATLSMSWQLAIVVLVPIIGGFELDRKLHTTPLLTIVGFVLAMVAMGLVVWRQLQIVAPPPAAHTKGARR
jgi:F0F1-type ATP synthase assembly protein I